MPRKDSAKPLTTLLHPGTYVRGTKLTPSGMSVTDAAKLIGVSRPGVSNFLNGKVSATPEMAARIERAFGIPAQTLLDLQAAFDAAQTKAKGAPANAVPYVAPFLSIKANDIEAWATHNIAARARFSVFLRALVHSTGIGLTKVEFHGNDDAERPGWDGYIEAAEGTPWVPGGASGWEFGVNEDVKGKADKDFAKSVRAGSKEQRANTTFVFVTPRRWSGKGQWVTAARATKIWKDVRAYDASDLEQWVAQSLVGQAWFANETGSPAQDVRSLDKCWSDWAGAANPALPGGLFDAAIEAGRRRLLLYLSGEPSGPLVIAADSKQEALAFVAQALGERGGPELAAFRDRVLVFDKPGVLPKLVQGPQSFIAVAATREVERELATISRSIHSIVVYPRNAANAEPQIVLEPLPYEAFRKALEERGDNRDEVARLANASGRSLTVLRRQLSEVPAVRTPEWAADQRIAGKLVPFLWVGAWNTRNETDKEALSLLADRAYDDLEKDVQALAQIDDAPVWSVGTFRGVTSKLDLFYAIGPWITSDELKHYFSMARMVLGEDDPALDLAEDERWAAAIHGKVREFSSAFREGVSETLVLLAVHGNNVFKSRLGIEIEHEAARVVRDLLPLPLTLRTLESNDRDLPTYAEAAPDDFLSIIEQDLKSTEPAVLGLLRPVNSGNFWGHPSRTGLLWALEGLSWSPSTLPRAAIILARLAEVEIADNWVNKPAHSLESIFRAWMPQTSANHEARLSLIRQLAVRFPDVAWKICLAQFGAHHQVGDYSHKPRWRPDGYGFGEPFPTWGPIMEFARDMVEMALTWKKYTPAMLGDLIERLHDLDDQSQARVWTLVEHWAATAADEQKAMLRERVRVATLSRRAARRTKKGGRSLTEAARKAYAALEPTDLLNRHAWLFREGWVEESADEIDEEDFDFRKRDERIRKLRADALREVYDQRGIEGLLELARRGRAATQIGWLAAQDVLSVAELEKLLSAAVKVILPKPDQALAERNILLGVLRSNLEQSRRSALLETVTLNLSETEIAWVLLLAPFRRATWNLVDALGGQGRVVYWQEVAPDWVHDSEDENKEAVERLLAAKRPRAAFTCAHFHPEKLGADLLFRLLSEVATTDSEPAGHYPLEEYSIEQAFKCIDSAPDLSLEQKAGLEFAYLEVLAKPWDHREHAYGIPNLERYIEQHPEIYVQAVSWAYKRNDDGKDRVEFQVAPGNVTTMARRAHKLLDGVSRIPGQDARTEFEKDTLAKWLASVRTSCSELARAEVGDLSLGRLLSNAPVGEDGVWPSEAVRDVMEDTQSRDIVRGAHTGVYNARGVVWRGEGGDQERELAAKYRRWGEALQFTHPYVSAHLLMSLAQTYEREANREDTEAGIQRRLQ
ncbi:MAG: addiction module antidote protein, HigA family [Mesorhizobium sp.]|uniref:HigA family addiction module antitoxin n=1 Tax=Mesorhizobium sp. TaxID=1871066 RepID=UPI000FE7AEA8|nr:HigA family addiction module antitoxin [Mesorhizobium sp.]RWN26107.1 MAG: addiction module antidote protein, HigA family [Mesorhizobium sp.]